MKEKLNKLLENPIYKTLGENSLGLLFGLFSFQFALFLFSLIAKQSFIILHVLAICLTILGFLFFKDFKKDKELKIMTFIFKAAVIFGVIALINHVFISGINAVNTSKIKSSITQVMLLVDLGSFIALLGMWSQEKIKEIMDILLEKSFVDILLKADEEAQPGDAVLGKNVDTGKPVILPLKDRYLHMLALGPTGSGKTSQTIIPMINRDMQSGNLGIIVIEPKGDLAEKVWAMAKHYGREVQYFNPILPDCPYFNPLYGDESDVIENMSTTFKMLSPDSPQFFLDMNDNLIRKSLKVLKRLYGDDATLLQLDALISNAGGQGEKMVSEFSKLPAKNENVAKENEDIALWFMGDYFTGAKGSKTATKTYENCSGVRSQVAKLVSNKYLRKVLNPPAGHGSDVDFDKCLEEGSIITIATAQGKLRDLGRFLGYFIILQLQACVFRRPGDENTRKGNMLYIDEFQVYANPGFEDMLTQGRSYRVASHLATQSRALIGRGGQAGKDFLEVVSTNCRNVVIYPGGSPTDDKYFEEYFGEIEEKRMDKGISKKKFSFINPNNSGGGTTISMKETVETKARFSATEIHNRPFGQITYALINHNSVQPPGVSQIEYIPIELNKKLDQMIADLREYCEQREKELDALENGEQPNNETSSVVVKDIFADELSKEIPAEIPSNSKNIASPIQEDADDEYVRKDEIKTYNTPVKDNNTYERGAVGSSETFNSMKSKQNQSVLDDDEDEVL